jgi:SAM-dependent methyltransferase
MNDPQIEALIALHAPVARQGPGDDALLDAMVDRLALPAAPRIAEMGCGSGHTARRLAARLGADVVALDFAPPFIAALRRDLDASPPPRGRVTPVEGDMLASGIADGSLDAIVSEGAVYNVGFAEALAAWRPLMKPGAAAIVSECVWWGAERPADAAAFWAEAYPAMGTVGEAVLRAEGAGWRLLAAERLPVAAWWANYYDPLAEQLDAQAEGASDAMIAVIADTRREMELFRRHADAYGYVLLALDTAG